MFTNDSIYGKIDFLWSKNIKMQLRCHKQNIKKKINCLSETDIGGFLEDFEKVDDDIGLLYWAFLHNAE